MSHDLDFEPIRGLPKHLPPGEHVIWQGAPAWRILARRAFKTRAVMLWFGAIIAFRIGQAAAGHATAADAGIVVLWQLGLGAAAVGILSALAWAYARSTVYTITNRRVVIRFGLAIDMAINLPFRHIAAAAAKIHADGTADIPLRLSGRERIGFAHLWPHARPWRFNEPEPMLRAVPDGEAVVKILADALAAYAATAVRTGETVPAAAPAGGPRESAPVPVRGLAAAH